MPNSYDAGTLVTFTGTFKDATLAPADPTDVFVRVRKPDGTVQVFQFSLAQVNKDGVGIYHKDILVNLPGRWYYKFEGTGVVQAARENYVLCKETVF